MGNSYVRDMESVPANHTGTIIVLGNEGAGKSTLLFLLVTILNEFATKQDILETKKNLRDVIFTQLMNACQEDGKYDIHKQFLPAHATQIRRLLKDTNDPSLQYFLHKLDTLTKPNYLPSNEDCLRANLRTMGSREYDTTIEGRKYTVAEMGGASCEQRKWNSFLNDFDYIDYLIIVVRTSESRENQEELKKLMGDAVAAQTVVIYNHDGVDGVEIEWDASIIHLCLTDIACIKDLSQLFII